MSGKMMLRARVLETSPWVRRGRHKWAEVNMEGFLGEDTIAVNQHRVLSKHKYFITGNCNKDTLPHRNIHTHTLTGAHRRLEEIKIGTLAA